MAAKALEADFDKWQRANGAKSDLVWLEMSEKSRTINFLLEGMDEFSLRFPEVYPPQNDSHRFVRRPQCVRARSLAPRAEHDGAGALARVLGDGGQQDAGHGRADAHRRHPDARPRHQEGAPDEEQGPCRTLLRAHASHLRPQSEKKAPKASDDDELIDDDDTGGGGADDGGADFDLESEELKERCGASLTHPRRIPHPGPPASRSCA